MALPVKDKTHSTLSLVAQSEHREWIGGRAYTLLSHYWRADDPVELSAALGADWADVLEGLPQEYIEAACLQWLRYNPELKPRPGHIYSIATRLVPRRPVVPEPERPEHVVNAEQRAVADDLCAEFIRRARVGA